MRAHRHALCALLALACNPLPAAPPPLQRDPLSPAGGPAQIAVRNIEARPKLAIIQRDGDPQPVLVIAVAAGLGPVQHAALAGMMEQRLAAAGAAAAVHSDGAGLRVAFDGDPSAAGDMERLLRAWLAASLAPAPRDEAAQKGARARVDALRQAPLDAPAEAPLAACSADAAALARDVKPPSGAELDSWRRQALVLERTAVAVVGTAAMGEDAESALERVEGWPKGGRAAAAAKDGHGAFFSGGLAPDEARLEVAVFTASAVDAVGAAGRLGDRTPDGGPLGAKLDALPAPWRLASVRATALPSGGCVRVALRPEPRGDTPHPGSGADDLDALAASAARATKTVWREMVAQSRVTTDAFVVTREIIAAGDAREAAARAAWWALSTPGNGPLHAASALAVGARPDVQPEGQLSDDDAIAAAYRGRVGQLAVAPAEPLAARRLATERGQGQLWLLVGSPCAPLHEGAWDAGQSALAVAAGAAEQADPEVDLEPWASADGVGIIAHGALHAADTAETLARRVATAAARAYASVPREPAAFARAQTSLLATASGDLGHAFFAFAERAAPDHPAWIASWGSPALHAAATLSPVAAGWRATLRTPTRVAVLANLEAAQGEVAAGEIDHWLLEEAAAQPCSEKATLSAPRAGAYGLEGEGPGVTVIAGAPYRGGEERSAAQLTAAALEGNGGLLNQLAPTAWRVQVVGGRRSGALVLSATLPDDQAEAARGDLVALLGKLAKSGPTAAADGRARQRFTRAARALRRHPRDRLVALWRGDLATTAPPDSAAWRAWLGKTLAADRLIVVSAE